MTISHKIWQAEFNRVLTQRLEMLKHLPPSPPMPWYRSLWDRLTWRISQAREWLGEKIAGRRFGDDY